MVMRYGMSRRDIVLVLSVVASCQLPEHKATRITAKPALHVHVLAAVSRSVDDAPSLHVGIVCSWQTKCMWV